MPQSLVTNYMHIIFGTKHREPLIHPPYEEGLYNYLGGICNNLECQVIQVGGYQNHVHILCLLSRKIALMKLLEIVKANSSKWMKQLHPDLENFYWQDGYAAFSVSPSQVKTTIAYIANQHEHHRDETFEDEYIGFLNKHNIAYDERFVWD